MNNDLYQLIMDIVSLSKGEAQDVFERLSIDFPERAAEIQTVLLLKDISKAA